MLLPPPLLYRVCFLFLSIIFIITNLCAGVKIYILSVKRQKKKLSTQQIHCIKVKIKINKSNVQNNTFLMRCLCAYSFVWPLISSRKTKTTDNFRRHYTMEIISMWLTWQLFKPIICSGDCIFLMIVLFVKSPHILRLFIYVLSFDRDSIRLYNIYLFDRNNI